MDWAFRRSAATEVGEDTGCCGVYILSSLDDDETTRTLLRVKLCGYRGCQHKICGI